MDGLAHTSDLARRLRAARWAGLTAVALAMTTLLTACSPVQVPLTAVRVSDGRPVLLFADCPTFPIDSVSLFLEHDDPAAAHRLVGWWLRRKSPVGPGSVVLLGDPPAGWAVENDDIKALKPAQKYGVMAFGSLGQTVPIVFTLEDLAALGPDHVLVGPHDSVTEPEFRRKAHDRCPPKSVASNAGQRPAL